MDAGVRVGTEFAGENGGGDSASDVATYTFGSGEESSIIPLRPQQYNVKFRKEEEDKSDHRTQSDAHAHGNHLEDNSSVR